MPYSLTSPCTSRRRWGLRTTHSCAAAFYSLEFVIGTAEAAAGSPSSSSSSGSSSSDGSCKAAGSVCCGLSSSNSSSSSSSSSVGGSGSLRSSFITSASDGSSTSMGGPGSSHSSFSTDVSASSSSSSSSSSSAAYLHINCRSVSLCTMVGSASSFFSSSSDGSINSVNSLGDWAASPTTAAAAGGNNDSSSSAKGAIKKALGNFWDFGNDSSSSRMGSIGSCNRSSSGGLGEITRRFEELWARTNSSSSSSRNSSGGRGGSLAAIRQLFIERWSSTKSNSSPASILTQPAAAAASSIAGICTTTNSFARLWTRSSSGVNVSIGGSIPAVLQEAPPAAAAAAAMSAVTQVTPSASRKTDKIPRHLFGCLPVRFSRRINCKAAARPANPVSSSSSSRVSFKRMLAQYKAKCFPNRSQHSSKLEQFYSLPTTDFISFEVPAATAPAATVADTVPATATAEEPFPKAAAATTAGAALNQLNLQSSAAPVTGRQSAFSAHFASTTGLMPCSCPDPNGPHGFCSLCAMFMAPSK